MTLSPATDRQRGAAWVLPTLVTLALVAGLVLAVVLWGLPALALAALVAVPVVFALLILVSLG